MCKPRTIQSTEEEEANLERVQAFFQLYVISKRYGTGNGARRWKEMATHFEALYHTDVIWETTEGKRMGYDDLTLFNKVAIEAEAWFEPDTIEQHDEDGIISVSGMAHFADCSEEHHRFRAAIRVENGRFAYIKTTFEADATNSITEGNAAEITRQSRTSGRIDYNI